MQQLGAVIRDARIKQRLSITEVHLRTRLNYASITRIERGKSYPRVSTLLTLCKAIGVKPSALFIEVDEKM